MLKTGIPIVSLNKFCNEISKSNFRRLLVYMDRPGHTEICLRPNINILNTCTINRVTYGDTNDFERMHRHILRYNK